MMRIRLMLGLFALSVFLMVTGGKEIREAAAFRKPQVMTCEQFTKSPPGEGWFKVTKGVMALPEAIFSYKKSKYSTSDTVDSAKITSVYLPVHPMPKGNEEFNADAPVALLVKTQDAHIIELVKEMNDLEKAGDKAVESWIDSHEKDIIIQKDISGMVQAGMDYDSKTRSDIANVQGTLAPNYAIIDEGRTPSMMTALAKLIGGIAIIVIGALYLIVSSRNG